MERIQLMRLILEQPLSRGGCQIDLARAEHYNWFTAVYVHDARSVSLRHGPVHCDERFARE